MLADGRVMAVADMQRQNLLAAPLKGLRARAVTIDKSLIANSMILTDGKQAQGT
jgi:hypothetical protein